jgi:hypothetical protein
MRYLFLLNSPGGGPPAEPGTPESERLFRQWGEATALMADAGVLIDCAPLTPAASATTLRVRDGEVLLTDGPSAELKEWIGGYTLVECDDLDMALKWASTLPAARDSSIEVRAVIDTGRGR